MFAKGSTIRTTLDFLNAEGGPSLVGRVLGDLAPPVREAVTRVEPTSELPYATLQALWRAADPAATGESTVAAASLMWHLASIPIRFRVRQPSPLRRIEQEIVPPSSAA